MTFEDFQIPTMFAALSRRNDSGLGRCRSAFPRRWMLLTLSILFLPFILPSLSGCRVVDRQKLKAESPLKTLQKSYQQTELEVIFIRIPPRDREATEQLWKEVDEQAVPAEFRRELNKNGFRVGVLGTQLPLEMEKIMQTAEEARENAMPFDRVNDQTSILAIRRRLFLSRGQRGELLASSVQPEFHILEMKRGEIFGRTLKDGQGQFMIEAAATDDGRVHIQLAPEVHYGNFRNQYVPGEGMFRLDTSRRKERFDHLRIEADLTNDQIMIIGPQSNQPGSLGHRFFNEQAVDKSVSKLLMIRVRDIASESMLDDEADQAADH
jgi:hypothetical protein